MSATAQTASHITERLREPYTQDQSRRVGLEYEAAETIEALVEGLSYAIRGFNALADEIEAHRPGRIPERDVRLMVREGPHIQSMADARALLQKHTANR